MSSAGKLIILSSYAGPEEYNAMEMLPQPRRIYAVLYLSFTGTFFVVDNVTGVPYQSVCTTAFIADGTFLNSVYFGRLPVLAHPCILDSKF